MMLSCNKWCKKQWLFKMIIITLNFLILLGASACYNPLTKQDKTLFYTYTVYKKVSDFPLYQDLSTPESACATIIRDYLASGASDTEWSDISIRKMSDNQLKAISSSMVHRYLNTLIVEVHIYKERCAQVILETQENGNTGYDDRYLFFNKGRWLNAGQGNPTLSLEESREQFSQKCDRLYRHNLELVGEFVEPRWNRKPVIAPELHLVPYVDFLEKQGRNPHDFMMHVFKKYKLVVMGEIHNRPQYWSFNADLVRDPSFPQSVGTIYMEMPSNHQCHIDKFLSLDTCDKEIVIQMLRDFFELGWPCKPTLDFFVTVWETNQQLPDDKKLRIRLVDMQRPWENILERKDWQQYDVDRDFFMAHNILDDLQRSKEKRNAFFIVGMGHAAKGFHYADKTSPYQTSGWYLKQALGDKLFVVLQHSPAMTNKGDVKGRLSLGLIDSAFAQRNDSPVAFTLLKGPFGILPFDGSPEEEDLYGSLSDGYDAYLYLVPLEEETLSPLIEGFYTDEFALEINRRYQLMFGRSLFLDTDSPTSERITDMRARYWGQPRGWVNSLGPENAWHWGDNWQTTIQQDYHQHVTRPEMLAVLEKIFSGMIIFQPDSPEEFDEALKPYRTLTDWQAMRKWWMETLTHSPLQQVEYGQMSRNQDGIPQMDVTIVLKGGVTMERTFRFIFEPLKNSWQVEHGLDLHLAPQ